MRPLKLSIAGSFWDSQIYAGRLYLFTDNGAIRTLDWDLVVSGWQIDQRLRLAMECAFRRSDYLYSSDFSLLLHDPEYRCVRREHLVETGKRIRLKGNIELLTRILSDGIDGHRFSFHVISAAPEEVIQSALEGIVPPENIYGTRFNFHPGTGEIQSIARVAAGYGKVAVLDELQNRLQVSPDQIIYMGDGSSDVHVMLHVNRRDGFTIAVSENRFIVPIARRTVLSDSALAVLIPILDSLLKWDSTKIRELIATYGITLQNWDKIRTDWLTFHEESRCPVVETPTLVN